MTEKVRRKPGRPKLPEGQRRDIRADIQFSKDDVARIDAIRLRTIPTQYRREWCYAAVMLVVAMAEGQRQPPQDDSERELEDDNIQA
jgi:hypothetical protein